MCFRSVENLKIYFVDKIAEKLSSKKIRDSWINY